MTAAVPLRVLAAGQGNRIGPDRDGAPVVHVPLQRLRFHPRNVRTGLGDLTALTESIRQEGVLVPLMAEKLPSGGLQLLHGHRRWAAADLAGLRRVPVVIVPAHTTDEAILLMLAENTGRAAVDPGDLRTAVKALVDEFGYTPGSVAQRLGVDVDVVTGWRSGRGVMAATRPAPTTSAPRPTRPPRPPQPKLRPKAVHDLLARRDTGELDDADVVAAVREWMGDWQPAAPAERVPPPPPSRPTGLRSTPSSPGGSGPGPSDPPIGGPSCVS